MLYDMNVRNSGRNVINLMSIKQCDGVTFGK